MQISFVVAARNASNTIAACLDSLGKTTEELNSLHVSSEIIVVDNASTDGTADKAQAAGVDITLVRNTVDKGFAATINQGIATGTGDLIITVCPLAGVQPGSVRRLIEHMETNPACGIAGGKLVSSKDESLPMLRKLPNCLTKFWEAVGCCCHKSYDQPAEVGQVSFLFAAIRRSLVENLGMLDERFTANFMDTDLCRRAGRSLAPKWKVAFIPQARAKVLDRFVLHCEPEAASLQGEGVVQARVRGEMLYLWKHHGCVVTALFAAMDIIGGTVRYVWNCIPGMGNSNKKAHSCMVVRHTAKAMLDTQLGSQLPTNQQ